MNRCTAVTAEIAEVIQHKRTGKWKFRLRFPFSEGDGTITIVTPYDFTSATEARRAMLEQAAAHGVKVGA